MPPSSDWLDDVLELLDVDFSLGDRWDPAGSVPAGTFAFFIDGRSKKRQHTLVQLIHTGGPQDEDIAERHIRTFQVLVVGNKQTPLPAYLKSEEIYNALHTQVALKPASRARTFAVFLAQAAPSLIGKDDNGNFQYSTNYLTEYREEVS